MFPRNVLSQLSSRLSLASPPPLLLLGATGTGKATLARQFGATFSAFIRLDLDTQPDRAMFGHGLPFGEVLRAIFFLKNKDPRHKRTLIFLREIQECPEALDWFRRSGSEALPYHIAASASARTPAIDAMLHGQDPKPDVCFVHPFCFEEFLQSLGDDPALEAFREVPVPVYAYEKLLNYFHLYALIGGMPAIIGTYARSRQLAGLRPVYEELLTATVKRAGTVARSAKHRSLLADTLQNAFPFAATRIRFNGFANLGYRSREIGDAFRTLERLMVLQLVYPVTPAGSRNENVSAGHERSPRLHLLDTGMVNYFSGIQKPLFQSHDMNAIFEGQIARQVVGQEILAAGGHNVADPSLSFWIRDKAQSTAEVDFVIPYDGLQIPVVVRSGEPGRLRSLHQFMDAAPHTFAVRLCAGRLSVAQTRTIRGKSFFLLNLPYFMAGKIGDHLKGFIRLANG